jgi:hypothetical protein
MRCLCVCVFFSSFTSFLWNKMLLQASDSIDNVETFMLEFRFFSVSLLLLSRLDTFVSINAGFQKTEFDFGIFIR